MLNHGAGHIDHINAGAGARRDIDGAKPGVRRRKELIGWLVARRFYTGDDAFSLPRRLSERLPFAHKLLLNKYWIDELYRAVIVRPVHRLAILLWRFVDELIIDTVFVNGAAFTVELTGDFLRFIQTGNVRNYALAVVTAILALAAVLW